MYEYTIDSKASEIKTYPLATFLSFVIGLLLGHPMAPGVGEGAINQISFWSRFASSDVAIFLLLIVFLLSFWRRRLVWPRYSRAFVVFLVGAVFSVFFSPFFSMFKMRGFAEIIIYLYLFITSVALFNIFLNERVQRAAVWGMAIGALTSMLLAYSVKFIGFPPIIQHSSHLQGSFRNGSQFGAYLFYVAFMIIPLYAFKCRGVTKKLMLILLMMIPLAIFLSSKRSAMGAFGIMLILGIFYIGFLRGKFIQSILISLVAVVTYFIFSNLLFPLMHIEDQEYFIERTLALKTAGQSGEFSTANLEKAVELFKRRPFTGSGLGMAVGGATEDEIHNSYLKFMGEGGLLMMITGPWLLIAMGLKGAYNKVGLLKEHLTVINCYRFLYFAVIVINFWAWGLRRREVWFVIAFIEAVKVTYYPEPTEQNSDESIVLSEKVVEYGN